MKKVLKNAVTVLLSVVLWGIILLMALFTFTTLATRDDQSVARLAGFTPLIVQSDSMVPTFHAGDLIVIKNVEPSKLEKGDIITFHTIINNQYALNTHRIAEIRETGDVRNYVTMGDNNDIEDTHIIADGDIVGQYVGKVPVLGKVLQFLSGTVGFLLVIVLPMLAFFIYQIYHLVMVSISLKKAMAVEEAEKKENQDSLADEKLAEAQAALEEAKRIKAEAEAQLAKLASQGEAEKAGAEEESVTEVPEVSVEKTEAVEATDSEQEDAAVTEKATDKDAE